MAKFQKNSEFKWDREQHDRRPDRRGGEDFEDLRAPKKTFREEYKRSDRHHALPRDPLQREVSRLLAGESTVRAVLHYIPLGTRQEPGQLVAILDRLRKTMKDDFTASIEKVRPDIRYLLTRLVTCREGISPDHVAKAFRCIEFFDIQDKSIIRPLTNKFEQLARIATENQTLNVIEGLADFAKHRKLMLPELRHLFEVLERKITRGSFESPTLLRNVLHTLSRKNLTHIPIQDSIHNALFGEGRNFEKLSLSDHISTMRFYALLSLSFPAKEFAFVCASIRRAVLHSPSNLHIADIAGYLSAAAMLSNQIPTQLVQPLEELFHEKLRSVPIGRYRARLIREAVPALSLLSNEPLEKTDRLLRTPLYFCETKSPSSSLERLLGDILYYDLGAKFDWSVHIGMFPVDFVITRGDGKSVNLEVDGAKYHLLYDVTQGAVTTTYHGSDLLRDKAIRKLGFLVARVRSDEAVRPRDLCDIVAERIRNAT